MENKHQHLTFVPAHLQKEKPLPTNKNVLQNYCLAWIRGGVPPKPECEAGKQWEDKRTAHLGR